LRQKKGEGERNEKVRAMEKGKGDGRFGGGYLETVLNMENCLKQKRNNLRV
jgi:hypothetical protein